jgi:hypothetical protein
MVRLPRMVAVALVMALALPLADCTDFSKFDPTDLMDGLFADQKKPLPGDRKPLFPEGTPGVQQGVPPDLVKGYQPPPEPPDDSQQPATPAKPKAKAKSKAAAPAASAAPTALQPN